jgi:hypothetical protein
MKLSNIILVSAAMLALGIGGLHLFDRLTAGAPVTAKTPEPAPPDPQSSDPQAEQPLTTFDSAAPEQDGAAVAGPAQPQQLVAEIERVLVAADPQQRETAFNSLLPQLLQQDPGSVVGLVARLPPGEPRDALREEVTRQWITRDRATAIEWIDTLGEAEKKASAVTAMRTLAASSPAEAIAVADKFGVGRDDGSLEHLVQIWAAENPDEALRWLATQPEGPQTEQLRARIEQARGARP